MGVPALFRWLQRKYPLIISNCIEEDVEIYEDLSKQNPNTVGDQDFDCLYLDMNGIIHPCFHPAGVAAPKSEEEIFANIEKYILRLFNIVRPRQLLFMAIDGVAPRAKMNQQRARRYRASKDCIYNRQVKIEEAHKANDTKALEVLLDPDYLEKHDSNVITPGTGFMFRLAEFLRDMTKRLQRECAAWRNIAVILSDASVPGEGEHKIMDFIRGQRLQSGYSPNRRHCVYGLDADLIFLGLGSHEMYFTVLREKVLDNIDGFHFLNIWVLRQYLENDLKPHAENLRFEWNFENAIDDFIFLCFLVGNDFLPDVPGVSIASGAINAIITTYPRVLNKMKGYITSKGVPDCERLIMVASQLVKFEYRTLNNIMRPSAHALAAQMHVNEICDTDEFDLEKMEHRNFDSTSKTEQEETNLPPAEELKASYYERKFGVGVEPTAIVKEYIRGMYWVMMYYTHGCASWDWYYPYLYAPCISDFVELCDYDLGSFVLGEPFHPLVQLMAVLPPQSAHCLPPKMRELMVDPRSPLHEFYPRMFKVDLNGQTVTWKGVVLIPFIDSKVLLDTVAGAELGLTAEEEARNKFGKTRVFVIDGTPETIANGPVFWGSVEKVGDEGEYLFEYPMVSEDQDLAFLLLNIDPPPYYIVLQQNLVGTRPQSKKAKNRDKMLMSFSSIGKRQQPLQVPGYPPSESKEYRARVMQSSKFGKCKY